MKFRVAITGLTAGTRRANEVGASRPTEPLSVERQQPEPGLEPADAEQDPLVLRLDELKRELDLLTAQLAARAPQSSQASPELGDAADSESLSEAPQERHELYRRLSALLRHVREGRIDCGPEETLAGAQPAVACAQCGAAVSGGDARWALCEPCWAPVSAGASARSPSWLNARGRRRTIGTPSRADHLQRLVDRGVISRADARRLAPDGSVRDHAWLLIHALPVDEQIAIPSERETRARRTAGSLVSPWRDQVTRDRVFPRLAHLLRLVHAGVVSEEEATALAPEGYVRETPWRLIRDLKPTSDGTPCLRCESVPVAGGANAWICTVCRPRATSVPPGARRARPRLGARKTAGARSRGVPVSEWRLLVTSRAISMALAHLLQAVALGLLSEEEAAKLSPDGHVDDRAWSRICDLDVTGLKTANGWLHCLRCEAVEVPGVGGHWLCWKCLPTPQPTRSSTTPYARPSSWPATTWRSPVGEGSVSGTYVRGYFRRDGTYVSGHARKGHTRRYGR